MPRKTGPDLKDPVGAIAREIVRVGSDMRYGKPGPLDFVYCGTRMLDLPHDDSRDMRIADALYADSGEHYATEQQMAAFIYAELTREASA